MSQSIRNGFLRKDSFQLPNGDIVSKKPLLTMKDHEEGKVLKKAHRLNQRSLFPNNFEVR